MQILKLLSGNQPTTWTTTTQYQYTIRNFWQSYKNWVKKILSVSNCFKNNLIKKQILHVPYKTDQISSFILCFNVSKSIKVIYIHMFMYTCIRTTSIRGSWFVPYFVCLQAYNLNICYWKETFTNTQFLTWALYNKFWLILHYQKLNIKNEINQNCLQWIQ